MQHPICCTQLPKTNFSHIKDWIALNEFTYTEEANGHFYDTVRSIFNATVQKKKKTFTCIKIIHVGFPKKPLVFWK